jgi:thioredoxin reductase
MEPMFTTNVPGVFAAGDCVTPMKAVVQAMATGAFCAGGVSAMLSAEMYG